MPEIDTHMCWVAGRTRVQRVGHAMQCMHCRRFKHKHKCGARTDPKDAWEAYPVEECSVCNPSLPRGEFSDGPSPIPPKEAAPPPPRSEPKPKPKRTAMERRRAKGEASRRKRKRAHLLLLTVLSKGTATSSELLGVLKVFGSTTSSRSLSDDLGELVQEGWLVREKIDAPTRAANAPAYLPKQIWRYSVNPGILGRIE